jgi:hypothetical protein
MVNRFICGRNALEFLSRNLEPVLDVQCDPVTSCVGRAIVSLARASEVLLLLLPSLFHFDEIIQEFFWFPEIIDNQIVVPTITSWIIK